MQIKRLILQVHLHDHHIEGIPGSEDQGFDHHSIFRGFVPFFLIQIEGFKKRQCGSLDYFREKINVRQPKGEGNYFIVCQVFFIEMFQQFNEELFENLLVLESPDRIFINFREFLISVLLPTFSTSLQGLGEEFKTKTTCLLTFPKMPYN